MAASSAEVHYVIRFAPLKGQQAGQPKRYEGAIRLALAAMAASFAAARLPLAEIEPEGQVVHGRPILVAE